MMVFFISEQTVSKSEGFFPSAMGRALPLLVITSLEGPSSSSGQLKQNYSHSY